MRPFDSPFAFASKRLMTAGVMPEKDRFPYAEHPALESDHRGAPYTDEEHAPTHERARHEEMHRAWFKWGRCA